MTHVTNVKAIKMIFINLFFIVIEVTINKTSEVTFPQFKPFVVEKNISTSLLTSVRMPQADRWDLPLIQPCFDRGSF